MSVDFRSDLDLFFDFELKSDLDCREHVFTIMSEQQGKELENYCWQSGVYEANEGNHMLQTALQPSTRSLLSGPIQANEAFIPSNLSLMLFKVVDERQG